MQNTDKLTDLTTRDWAELRRLCLAIEMGAVRYVLNPAWEDAKFFLGTMDVSTAVNWLLHTDVVVWDVILGNGRVIRAPRRFIGTATTTRLAVDWGLFDAKEAKWAAGRKARLTKWLYRAIWAGLVLMMVLEVTVWRLSRT